jgi:hypothetical protein
VWRVAAGGVLPRPDEAAAILGVVTVNKLAASLALALVVFGLGQAGALRSVGVRSATVAHACLEDGCVVEAGAFVTCLSNDACRNSVVIACVAILGFVIGPLTANSAIVGILTNAYNAASSGTKWALDSLASTINNALGLAQSYFAPSAAEKAGLQNLGIAVSVAQGMDLVTPGVGGFTGMYHRISPTTTDTMTVVFTSPVYSSCTGTCTIYFTPVFLNGADEPLTNDIMTMAWKVLSSTNTILQSGSAIYVVGGGTPLTEFAASESNNNNGWAANTSITLSTSFQLNAAARGDISNPGHHYYYQGMQVHFGGTGTPSGTLTYDVGSQASYPVGTFLVNQTAGYWDRIGFSNTATPDPGSLGHGIGDQQIAIATGTGVAGTGLIGSLIGKTVHRDSTGQAIGATPTVTNTAGAVVPIVQPITSGAITAQNGIATNILSIPAAIASAITGTLTGVTAIAAGLATFFDLSIPIQWSRLHEVGVALDRFPFSIPFDVVGIAGSVFSVAPVAPSFSGDIQSGILGHTWTATMSLTAFSGVMAALRWGELVALIIGVALAYRKWAGGAV